MIITFENGKKKVTHQTGVVSKYSEADLQDQANNIDAEIADLQAQKASLESDIVNIQNSVEV